LQKDDEKEMRHSKVMKALKAKLKSRREAALAGMCKTKYSKGRITPLRSEIIRNYKRLGLWEFSSLGQVSDEEEEEEDDDMHDD
jgi:hypothetical protein